LELYLPPLNLVLVGLITLIGVLGAREGEGLGELYAVLPASVFAIVIVVKLEIASLDVHIGELEGLKYEYKGA
jgi:hypothetical protein